MTTLNNNNLIEETIEKPSISKIKEIAANTVRPVSMDEVVGMDYNKKIIYYNIEGCKKLNEPYPSFICSGPAGTGKTTIAAIIATLTGGQVHKYLGSDIRKADDIYQIAAQVLDNDVVFIEEAHTLNKQVQAVLLEWLEHFKLLGGGDGVLDAPKVCFIFPTTNAGRLTPALRTRCKLLHTSYYEFDQMRHILLKAAAKYNIEMEKEPQALDLLAQSGRGTPRVLLYHRLDPIRKMMAVDDMPFGLELVKKFFETHRINEFGLDNNDQIYLSALYDKTVTNKGRPVSQKTMLQVTGFELDVLSDLIESYLQQINVINISSQGRRLTDLGYEILGEEPINPEDLDILKSKSINLNKLSKLLEDPENLKGGMKCLVKEFGLIYGMDNGIMRVALRKLGYIPRQRAGIVKIEQ